ncbi:hypothetical protein N7492_010054 [Penicillium capsulatum]|uniref:Uncharacterized protein n=1 Tax=Penicillium capsulatum TaxID=69766 RepID=A0A9W9HMP3_9EURO|nr:hypothetical protein N7492_010054 [Penicillium capsulatum]KAJ6112563.1 hypothetical protein N7512_007887 [Penicillium capsulatum]
MRLDMTMLAPGPAGTTMIGESNIDAAARRGRERMRREQEAKEAELAGEKGEKVKTKDSDAQSEKTLTAQTSTAKDSDQKSETTLAPSTRSGQEGRSRDGIRGRWERIQRKWKNEGSSEG